MANKEHLAKLRERVEAWNQWRQDNFLIRPDLRKANLREVNLIWANLIWTNLREADLREADLSGANLSMANLSEADLSWADLSWADLSWADLSGANLSGVNLKKANLSGQDLNRKDFSEVNLTNANLSRVNLKEVNLSWADLSNQNFNGQNLMGVNLSDANLTRIQALGTNFQGATFTGACIEDWNINSQTNLDQIICDYVYLKQNQQERRPASANFAHGDFTHLFQKAMETVDLIFRDGIDWNSFAVSFQELQEEQRLKIEEENNQFAVRAIETRDDGSFVIRINVPAELDKAEIEESFRVKYENKLQLKEAQYRAELNMKDRDIAHYQRENTRLDNIVNQLASRPIYIQNINQPQNSDMSHIHQNHSGSGDNVAGNKNITNNYNAQNLSQAAAKIQQLLQQLQQNQVNLEDAQHQIAKDLVVKAQQDSTFRSKLIKWGQSLGDAAAKTTISEAVKGVIKLALSLL